MKKYYRSLQWTGLGCLKGQYKIKLATDTALLLLDKVKAGLQRMEEIGIIIPTE